jgi:high affinity cGMP-specific 3',5'-cyclic phosphodiesterase 9
LKIGRVCSELKLTEEIRRCLRMPTFDNWQWEDPEILLLLQQMYVDLNLAGPGSKFGIEMPVLRKFLCQVYMNYNEVPFHNFHHCFCVSQMVTASCGVCIPLASPATLVGMLLPGKLHR